MRAQHAHPVSILGNLWRVLYLIIIPVLRGFLSALRGGLAAWLSGAWLDIMILSLMIAFAVLRWHSVEYSYDSDQLYIHGGVLFQRETRLPWDHIITLSVIRSFYLRPIGAVRLRAETLGGSHKDADFSILLSPKRAQELLLYQRERKGEPPAQAYNPKTGSILSMAVLNSNSFAGVIYIATFVWQSGKLLGGAFSDRLLDTVEEVTRLLAFGIPPAAAALAYILLGGWAVGFLLTFIRYHNIIISRTESSLQISGGILTQRHYTVNFADVNYIDIRQSLTTRMLRLHSLFISAVGYGKNKDDISCIIPTENAAQFHRVCWALFPAFKPSERQLGARFTGIMRFITAPLYVCLGIPVAGALIAWLAPAWSRFLLFVTLMLLIPAALFLTIRVLDFRTGGVSVKDGVYTLRYSKGYYLHTIVCPRDQIVQVRVVQGFWQRFGSTCDVIVHTRAESRAVHRCRSLHREDVLRLFEMAEPER